MTLRLPIHLEQESADFLSLALRECFLRHLWGRLFCFAQFDYSRYHSVLLKRGCEISTYAIGVILQRRILVLVCACGLPACPPASRKLSVAHSSWRGVRSARPSATMMPCAAKPAFNRGRAAHFISCGQEAEAPHWTS